MKFGYVLAFLMIFVFLASACSQPANLTDTANNVKPQNPTSVVSTVNVVEKPSSDASIEIAKPSEAKAEPESRVDAIQEPEGSSQIPEGISLSELSAHNTKEDCWVAYEGKVYDLTSWIPKHPGGPQIAKYCGTSSEFTSAFNGQHGTSKEATLAKMAEVKGDFIG